MDHKITLSVNGYKRELEVEARALLLDVLRDDLELTGSKPGCETNVCGSCTVLMDGDSVHACSVLAIHADGKAITTIEGLSHDNQLHPVQQAFLDNLGFQCGYCTPGMVLTSVALLEENASPSDDEIKSYLAGNICRCTGYKKIIKSVQAASHTN